MKYHEKEEEEEGGGKRTRRRRKRRGRAPCTMHWATGLEQLHKGPPSISYDSILWGMWELAMDQTLRVPLDERVQHPSRGLREDTFLACPPQGDSITLGQAGILTHKRMLQLFFQIMMQTQSTLQKCLLHLIIYKYAQKSWSQHQ